MTRHWGKYRDIGMWPLSMIDTVKGTVVPVVRVPYDPHKLPAKRNLVMQVHVNWMSRKVQTS